jgi:hypothetical protein
LTLFADGFHFRLKLSLVASRQPWGVVHHVFQ